MDGLDFDRIDVEEAAILDEVFVEEEVFSALSDLNGDKTLNLDGFSLSFWQFCWDFVKYKVMGFLKEFPEQSRFVRSLNSTFLVLIKKKWARRTLEILNRLVWWKACTNCWQKC